MRKSRKLPASQKSSRGGRIRRPPEWLLMSGIEKLRRGVKMKFGREVKMTGNQSQVKLGGEEVGDDPSYLLPRSPVGDVSAE